MRRGIILLVLGFCACTVQNNAAKSAGGIEEVLLDFRDCNFRADRKFLRLEVPVGYRLRRSGEYGFCEYLFLYNDKSTLYVSSNIADGSSLNYQNRLNKGISTYSENRSKNDTIRNSGLETDSDYWLEWIIGTYTIGYIDVSDSSKFAATLESVRLVEKSQ